MTGPRALSFRNDPTLVVVVGLLAAVFWLLRIYYWSITVEEPFSDMTDYIETARQIKTHFFFGLREGLYAYYNPVTPSLLAISMILGGDSFLWVFRVLVQLIAFIATLLLAYEIAILTGRRWLGIALLAAVALCRPSIFWSLKPSTETPSEALLLASIGLGLHAYRTRSLSAAAACGLMCIFLSLNRSQFLPSALIVGAIFLYSTLFRRGEKTWDMQTAVSSRRWFARVRLNLDSTRLAQTICFALGLAVVWTPWIARNYAHYGAIIPSGTSGMDTMIFDLAGAPIRVGRYTTLQVDEDLMISEFGFRKIRAQLGDHNDYEIAQVERRIFWAWFRANWRDFPRLMEFRIRHLIAERGAYGLTQVSRDVLFPSDKTGWNNPYTDKSWIDLVLLDKDPFLVLLGFGGILVAVFRYGLPGLMLGSISGLPWLTVAVVTGFERAAEPMTSITLWLAIYFLSECVLRLSERNTVPESYLR